MASSCVLNIQLYPGTRWVREYAVVDVKSLKVCDHFCFSKRDRLKLSYPLSGGLFLRYPRSGISTHWFLHVLKSFILSKFDYVFVKGFKIGYFLRKALPELQIYILDYFNCLSSSVLDKNMDNCYYHPSYVTCALSRALALAKWCRESNLDLHNWRVRLLTFRNWSGGADAEDLAKHGMVQWDLKSTKCVYCNAVVDNWLGCSDIADHHSWNSLRCQLLQKGADEYSEQDSPRTEVSVGA